MIKQNVSQYISIFLVVLLLTSPLAMAKSSSRVRFDEAVLDEKAIAVKEVPDVEDVVEEKSTEDPLVKDPVEEDKAEDDEDKGGDIILEDGDDGDDEGAPTVSSASFSTGLKDIDVALYKGDATLSIPIASIPGHDVVLTYNSDVDNNSNTINNISQASDTGLGFSLSAGFIYRDYGSPSTGGKDFMSDTSDDSFYLSLPAVGGGKLVPLEGTEVELEDGFRVKTYASKSESYAVIKQYLSPNGKYVSKWEITDLSGNTYLFDHRRETVVYEFDDYMLGQMSMKGGITGCSVESDCTEEVYAARMLKGSDRMNYQWDLSKITDKNGNEINLEYIDEQRSIAVSRAYDITIDTACLKPYSDSEFKGQDGNPGNNNELKEINDCVLNIYAQWCPDDNCPEPGSLQYTNFMNAYGSCNSESGTLCDNYGGECHGFGTVCDNATVLSDTVVAQVTGGVIGTFLCPTGQSCWVAAEPGIGYPLSCHSSEGSVGGNCTAYGGDDISGGYQNTLTGTSTCRGYYVGLLRNPNDRQGAAMSVPGDDGEDDGVDNMITGRAVVDKDGDSAILTNPQTAEDYADQARTQALEQGATPEQAEEVWNLVFDRVRMQSAQIAEKINDPRRLSLIHSTPYSDGVSWEIAGETHCCASLNTEEYGSGKWYSGGNNECHIANLGGGDSAEESEQNLRERYFFGEDETFEVGCYDKFHGNPLDQQYCVGYDVGPANCNGGGDSPLVQSCCVGKIVSQRPTTKGSCVKYDFQVTHAGGDEFTINPVDACSVDYRTATCGESYTASSHLESIYDNKGNRIEFTYVEDRIDFEMVEPTKIEVDICPGIDKNQEKTKIFEESEHVTTNQELRLTSVITYAQDRRVSKVDFSHSYATEPDKQSEDDAELYRKLMLDSIQMYGQTDNRMQPPISFEYGGVEDDSEGLLLKKVTYPTGGSMEFAYEEIKKGEDEDYNFVRARVHDWGSEYVMSCDEAENYGITCPNVAGYRIKSKTVSDGILVNGHVESYTTEYEYGTALFHVSRGSNFVGHDSVTTVLPGDYGYVQTWFYNDRSTTANVNSINSFCQALPDIPSSYDVIHDNKFYELSDFAYKSESRTSSTEGSGVVSSSQTFVCPVKIRDQEDSADTFQNRLYKTEQMVDGLTTSIEYSSFNDDNGLPEVTTTTNTDGSIFRTTTSYISGSNAAEQGMLERNMKAAPSSVVTTSDDETTRTDYIYAFFRDGERINYDCSECTPQLYQESVLTDSNGQYDVFSINTFDSYDNYGNLLQATNPRGKSGKKFFGNNGECSNEGEEWSHAKLTCTENALGFQTRIYYDLLGRLDKVVGPNGITKHYVYDTSNRLVEVMISNEGQNLLSNPGFEEGQIDWVLSDQAQIISTPNSPSYTIHSGRLAMKIVSTHTQTVWQNDILLDADHISHSDKGYWLSGWIYREPGYTGNTYFDLNDAPYDNGDNTATSTEGEWVFVKRYIDDIEPRDSYTVRFVTDGNDGNPTGTVYFDDIALTKAEPFKYATASHNYNYGVLNCETLEEGDDDCMNWVESTTLIDSEQDLYAKSRSYSDGLAMSMRSVVMSEMGNYYSDIDYNELAKVKKTTESQQVAGSASAIYGERKGEIDEESSYVYTTYEHDPLARVSKIYPLASHGSDNPVYVEHNYYTDGDYAYHEVTDLNGLTTTSKADKWGRVVEVTDTFGKTVTREYDDHSRLINIINREGRDVLDVTYDKLGRVKTKWAPNDGQTSYSYDANGNLLSLTDEEKVVNNIYDDLDRLVEIKVDNVAVKRWFFDTDADGAVCSDETQTLGLLCEVQDLLQNTKVKYQYDVLGNVLEVEEYLSGQVALTQYEYTDGGLVNRVIQDNGKTLNYNYNDLSEVESVTINDDQEISFSYNPEGTIYSINYPTDSGSIVQLFDYWPQNWVKSIIVDGFFEEHYEYDDSGNLRFINDDVEFVYDDQYRLSSVIASGYYSVDNFDLTRMDYQYDAVGNRVGRSSDESQVQEHGIFYYEGTDRLASVSGDKNILPNPGFELVEDGLAVGFERAARDTSVEVVSSPVYSGSSSLRVTRDAYDYPTSWISANSDKFGGYIPGQTYTFSAYVNVPGTITGYSGAYVRLKCYTNAGQTARDATTNSVFHTSGWVRVTGTTTIPSHADYCRLSAAIGSGASGVVHPPEGSQAYFDNIQVEQGSSATSFQEASCYYEFDALGRLRMKTCGDDVTTLQYNVLGQLISIDGDGYSADFVYGPSGNRLKKTETGGGATTITSYVYGLHSQPMIVRSETRSRPNPDIKFQSQPVLR